MHAHEETSMKWAMLSDIHANWQAFSTCLAHAQAQGAERFAVLGDTVGYGADPVLVLDAVMALHAQGALVLQGNHDAMAVQPPTGDDSVGSMTSAWTHQQLRPEQRRFLSELPLVQRLPHMLLVHASAHQPQRWPYVDNERSAQQCLDAAMDAGAAVDTVAQVHVFVARGWPRWARWGNPAMAIPKRCTPCTTMCCARWFSSAWPMTTAQQRPAFGKRACPNTLPNGWRKVDEIAGTRHAGRWV
jgi:predicted phosphodiesterase